MRSSPEIIRNGFKKAGIISAIEDGVEQAALVADATLESDKDPLTLTMSLIQMMVISDIHV